MNSSSFTLILLLLLVAAGCQQSTTDKPSSEEHPLILQRSSSPLNPDQPIRLRFARPIQTNDLSGAIKLDGAAFQALMLDSFEVQLQPDPLWKKGSEIHLTLAMDQLFGERLEGSKTTKLEFTVKAQHFSVSTDGITIPDESEPNQLAISGRIQLAIPENGADVAPILQARQGQTQLPIKWQHQGQTHGFLIENIQRASTASEVVISWNGDAIQAVDQGELTVAVPAIGDFMMLSTRVEQGNPPAIQVVFSDILDPAQDFTGLVYQQGATLNFRYQVNGNQLWLYPDENIKGSQVFIIDPSVKNADGKTLGTQQQVTLNFEPLVPAIHLLTQGAIIPHAYEAMFQFEAVSLNKIDVELYRIHESNVLQFLQVNRLSGNNELERVADRIRMITIDLSQQTASADLDTWSTYQLDLTSYFADQPHAFYEIKLSFRPEYARTACSLDWLDQEIQDESAWSYGYFGAAGYYPNYWDEREDPCRPAFYNTDHFVQQTLIATQIGLMAKRSDAGEVFIVTTDLPTGKPLPNVDLELFSFSQQSLAALRSDDDGFARYLPASGQEPVFITARHAKDQAYLNMLPGEAISLSQFDVSGVTRQDGLQCFLYGERGVWRPGDTLFLHAILEQSDVKLPDAYPIQVTLNDPQGRLILEKAFLEHTGPIYPITLTTKTDAPTGVWSLQVRAGGAVFQKNLKIESIKPNRIKMELAGLPDELLADQVPVTLSATWLFGAPARNLAAKVELTTRPMKTSIPGFTRFQFDDPGRNANAVTEDVVLFDGILNNEGKAGFTIKPEFNQAVGGMVKAELTTRVFEASGDFSTRYLTRIISPFASYAGLFIPENDYGYKRFDRDKEAEFSLVNVDAKGKILAGRKLSISIYAIGWSWWYESDDDRFYRYSNGNAENAVFTTELTTDRNGKASLRWMPTENQGYFIRVCDISSGHCSGDVFYVGYPWDDEQAGTSYLTLQTDSQRYEVNDQIHLEVPVTHPGKMLVTVEKQNHVLTANWYDVEPGDQVITFSALPSFAPHAYVSVTLIQGTDRQNDLPLRSFGVVPIEVYYPERKLQPNIDAPLTVRPEVPFQIKVTEKSKREMQYTVAIVDEGLLDLTSFSTPDPYAFFNRKEALGVQTWDVYDQVISSFIKGGKLLAIGGDDAAKVEPGNQEMRFKPVVRVLGPFHCEPGKTNSHQVTIHNYVGAVRVMVIAANQSTAYGQDEQSIQVKQPLMVLATAPRKLSPGETAYLPVNLFVNDQALGNTEIKVSDQDEFLTFDRKATTLQTKEPGEYAADFQMTVPSTIGKAELLVQAQQGKEQARQRITLPVTNPNPYLTSVQEAVIQAGTNQPLKTEMPGMDGTNTAILELSTMPALDLQRRLEYLIHYPYGCAEQTTSSAFPQLYLPDLVDLNPTQKAKIATNILATIDRLKRFQHTDGGFTFWPGSPYMDEYITSYAGHFLLLAKNQGYPVPGNMLDRWKKIQKKWSNSWSPGQESKTAGHAYGSSIQIYRLYTLALAGEPDIGSMNRLRTSTAITPQDFYRLAATYALAGRVKEANKMLQGKKATVVANPEWNATYGDDLRDQAMLLEALQIVGQEPDAMTIVKNIADALNSTRWYSTQSVAYALYAITSFYKDNQALDATLDASIEYAGMPVQKIRTAKPMFVFDVNASQISAPEILVKNSGQQTLFAKWIITGKPLDNPQEGLQQKIGLTVQYTDMDGKSLDPASIPQGTDFKIVARVTHQTGMRARLQNLALSIGVPSGWEILPVRLSELEEPNALNYSYQDIRDDRVDTFFDLDPAQSKSFTILAHASYAGRFRLPTQLVEAMYDHSVQARIPGQWVEVIRAE
ncbi:MAG: MG2 domain-containing protein [Saprospiraceae bacterium]